MDKSSRVIDRGGFRRLVEMADSFRKPSASSSRKRGSVCVRRKTDGRAPFSKLYSNFACSPRKTPREFGHAVRTRQAAPTFFIAPGRGRKRRRRQRSPLASRGLSESSIARTARKKRCETPLDSP